MSEFQGLCGFRPLEEIAQHLSEIPELKAIVGETAADMVVDGVSGDAKAQSKALKAAFEALMSADETRVREETTKLIRRINEKPSTERSAADCVVLSANEDFPGDVGLLSVYMLNVVKLQPGDGMFLKPNFPHAYLKGDCVELMATSDNVVRSHGRF